MFLESSYESATVGFRPEFDIIYNSVTQHETLDKTDKKYLPCASNWVF